MAKVTEITEHFQHFVSELQDSFWGDMYDRTRVAWRQFWNTESLRARDQWMELDPYQRSDGAREYRNGFYERDYVTRMGTIRLRIARTRNKNFLPAGLERFQRRAEEVAMLIREAFLRGISTRQVGRVVAILTGEAVSAQTVSTLTRNLDQAVRQFHQARLSDWEGLLQDLYRRGLEGKNLQLIVTDGCPGLAAAIPTVYPRALHQRCWVHKMRNILEKVRKSDNEEVKRDAQAIYLAGSRKEAQAACRCFAARWRKSYPTVVRQLQRDLPELLSFFNFPQHLWRKLRTTNIIERCFVEVRRRTRPMVCFVNVESVDRIIYSIFQRFNLDWKNRTLKLFTQAA
jgi:putative transposase